MDWDPQQYTRYADERGRPFLDLIAQVNSASPRRIVDVGCGPGNFTALLPQRWPEALVDGLDSSPEMIEKAAAVATERLRFTVADATSWTVPDDADIVVSNAVLQWIPDHDDLLRSWLAGIPSGGWLAFQLPGNWSSPSHQLMREVAASPRWSDQLQGVLRDTDWSNSPAHYAELLLSAGARVNAWETTYVHVLPGPDPVLEWVRGTGLRPVLAALSAEDAAEYEADYGARLRAAYPATEHGTLFPFRRNFVVAHKP